MKKTKNTRSHDGGIMRWLLALITTGWLSVGAYCNAGELVPHHGRYEGMTIAPGVSVGAGVATHIGRFTIWIMETNPGEFVWETIAANGDSFQGASVLTSFDPATGAFTTNWTITGGTGRFSGMTGNRTTSGQYVSETEFVDTLDGVISTVGSNKK